MYGRYTDGQRASYTNGRTTELNHETDILTKYLLSRGLITLQIFEFVACLTRQCYA